MSRFQRSKDELRGIAARRREKVVAELVRCYALDFGFGSMAKIMQAVNDNPQIKATKTAHNRDISTHDVETVLWNLGLYTP
jgi:hypothetical protein